MKKTAECVTPHHPDKLCDQISDAILDAYLEQDPTARVAIETMGKSKNIYISGEVTSNANIDIKNVVNNLYPYLKNFDVNLNITKQSPFIAQGVDTGGAGDQGIRKGYATSETEGMIPKELLLARKLAQHVYKFKQTDG
ncbi:MAG: S-adenosylmethionine synthase, partial [candidate division WS6 bacterium GW2011_GWA2_37_6]